MVRPAGRDSRGVPLTNIIAAHAHRAEHVRNNNNTRVQFSGADGTPRGSE